MERRQILISAGIVGAIVFILAIIKYVQISSAMAAQMGMQPPPEAVTTASVAEVSWPRKLEAVGSISAVNGVVLSAEVAGTVSKIHFESGAEVPAGAVIIELDTAVEEANLRAVQVIRDREELAYKRTRELISASAASKATMEAAEAAFRAAEAEVKSIQAQIDRKRFIAPFAGRLGIRHVNLGEYVNVGQSVIPLFDLKDLYIDFSIPQRDVTKLGTGLKVEVNEESLAGKVLSGQIATIDPQIDPVNRNIKVRAVITNQDDLLKPGMFVRASVYLPQADPLLVIPSASIQYAPYGDSVFVVENAKDENNPGALVARQQFVKLGQSRGNMIAVLDGLKAGDQVVSSGTFKLRPGAAVMIKNDLAPVTEVNPNLPDT